MNLNVLKPFAVAAALSFSALPAAAATSNLPSGSSNEATTTPEKIKEAARAAFQKRAQEFAMDVLPEIVVASSRPIGTEGQAFPLDHYVPKAFSDKWVNFRAKPQRMGHYEQTKYYVVTSGPVKIVAGLDEKNCTGYAVATSYDVRETLGVVGYIASEFQSIKTAQQNKLVNEASRQAVEEAFQETLQAVSRSIFGIKGQGADSNRRPAEISTGPKLFDRFDTFYLTVNPKTGRFEVNDKLPFRNNAIGQVLGDMYSRMIQTQMPTPLRCRPNAQPQRQAMGQRFGS